MTVLYWPRDELDCTDASRRIAHESTVHMHFDTDREAGEAFVALFGPWIAFDDFGNGIHANYPALFAANARYHCIRGPGGLVRDVKP